MPGRPPEQADGAGREDPRPSAVALSLGTAGPAQAGEFKGGGHAG